LNSIGRGAVLPRDEVVRGIDQELGGYADLVRSLDERELAQPSRCEGWTAGDVAAHLIGAFADVTSGRIEGQGTPEVSERQAAERRGRTAGELADELDEVRAATRALLAGLDDDAWSSDAGGGHDMTVGEAMESMWSGAYIHADDIRAAVGRPSERGPGLRASVHNVADLLTKRRWGPAILELDGLDAVPVGGPIDESSTPRITGDPLTFVLAATGRADPSPLGLDNSVHVFA
jgi:uncharacterized protein (TIGR03083 family)